MAHSRGRRDSRDQRQAAQFAMWRKDGHALTVSAHDAHALTNGAFGKADDWHPENMIRLVDLATAYVK